MQPAVGGDGMGASRGRAWHRWGGAPATSVGPGASCRRKRRRRAPPLAFTRPAHRFVGCCVVCNLPALVVQLHKQLAVCSSPGEAGQDDGRHMSAPDGASLCCCRVAEQRGLAEAGTQPARSQTAGAAGDSAQPAPRSSSGGVAPRRPTCFHHHCEHGGRNGAAVGLLPPLHNRTHGCY